MPTPNLFPSLFYSPFSSFCSSFRPNWSWSFESVGSGSQDPAPALLVDKIIPFSDGSIFTVGSTESYLFDPHGKLIKSLKLPIDSHLVRLNSSRDRLFYYDPNLRILASLNTSGQQLALSELIDDDLIFIAAEDKILKVTLSKAEKSVIFSSHFISRDDAFKTLSYFPDQDVLFVNQFKYDSSTTNSGSTILILRSNGSLLHTITPPFFGELGDGPVRLSETDFVWLSPFNVVKEFEVRSIFFSLSGDIKKVTEYPMVSGNAYTSTTEGEILLSTLKPGGIYWFTSDGKVVTVNAESHELMFWDISSRSELIE